MVGAGGGDLQRTLDALLPHHIGKVQAVRPDGMELEGRLRLNELCALQMPGQLGHIPDGIDRQALADAGLRGIFRRDEQGSQPCLPGSHGHGQHPGGRLEPALQRQLAQKACVGRWRWELSGGAQQAHQHGQVIDRAFLFQVAGGQIHCDAPLRKIEAAVFHRRPDPVPGLLDRGVRQAHDIKLRQPAAEIALAQHRLALDADDPAGMDICYHSASSRCFSLCAGAVLQRAGFFHHSIFCFLMQSKGAFSGQISAISPGMRQNA